MNGAGRRVLVVLGKSHATGLLVQDLVSAGFEVEHVSRGRDALASARALPPAAIVAPEYSPGRWRRALAREAALASVPLVGITPFAAGKSGWIPFFPSFRWDAVLLPHELHLRGVPAAAVRGAIARGPRRAATGRERAGARLVVLGSALVALAFLLLFGGLASFLLGATSPVFGTLPWWLVVMAGGHVCGDVGFRLGRGLRPGLSRWTWVYLAGALLTVVLAVVRAANIGA